MDRVLIRTFLEVARHGGMQNAANAMGMTHTGVSLRIRKLEEVLDRQLFIRGQSGANLTPAGERFYSHALKLTELWERARIDVANDGTARRTVSVGGELALWDPLLLDWLVWMKHHQSGVAIRARVDLADRLIWGVREGVFDFVLVNAPNHLDGLDVEKLMDEELILVRSAGNQDEEHGRIDVDWRQSGAAAELATAEPGRAALNVNLGPMGLRYMLAVGGTGYFRRRAVEPFVKDGRLVIDETAPAVQYGTYLVSRAVGRNRLTRAAIEGMREIGAQSCFQWGIG